MGRLTPNDKEDLAALVKELIDTGRQGEAPKSTLNLKDGADVLYKILGIAAGLVALILWIGALKSDITSNKYVIDQMRETLRDIETRLRSVERGSIKSQ